MKKNGRKEKGRSDEWSTGNVIGKEGTKSLIEILKSNATLASLNLRGEEEVMKRKRKKEMMND